MLEPKVGYVGSLFGGCALGKSPWRSLWGFGSCHLRAAQEGTGNILLAPEEDPRFPTHWILGLKSEGEGRWQRGQEAKATPFRQAFC